MKRCLAFLLAGIMTCGMVTTVQAQDSVHIDLNKALEIALSESPSMRIADRNVQIKQVYKKEQIVSLFPDVSIASNYNRTLLKQTMSMDMGGQTMNIKVGRDNTYSVGANLSLPLVSFPLWSSLKLSSMDIDLALESARSSKIELVNQVKQAYYTYLLAKQSLEVLQASYNNLEASNTLVTQSFEQGLVSEFEKLRSDVALQNQRPAVSSAAKAVKLAAMRLKVVLGMDVNEPVIFDGQLSDYENAVLSATMPSDQELQLAYNSALRQMDIGIEQLEQSKKIVRGASLPMLALAGAFQYSGMGDDGGTFTNYPYSYVALSLQIPIVGWAATHYKLKQSDLNIQNLKDQRLDLERNLRLGVQSYLNDMQQAIEDIASDSETMRQAQKAYDIAQKQYEVGMNTWLDLRTTELTLTTTQLTYCQDIFNYLTAKANLDATLGAE
ncbi:MAG: TolC family protein [Bacteroidales bacterium]|nr:TolC family protein [Bacteroidales bacterium]MBR6174357.1 TolC family protein [Bacteroidales bacterium]